MGYLVIGSGGRWALVFVAVILSVGSGFAQESEAPLLVPGDGWDGPTLQPQPVGSGPGADAKAIARWDVVPYQTIDCDFEIGVVAFHINGIDRVEFSVENGPWVPVREMTVNPRTGVKEYWAVMPCDNLSDGPIEVRAVAYPKVGIPRVLAGDDVMVNNGEHSMFVFANSGSSFQPKQVFVSLKGSDANSGARQTPWATLNKALDAVPDGGEIVLLDAGTYEAPNRPYGHQYRANQRWITVRPDDGLAPRDVIIGKATWGTSKPNMGRLRWERVTFDFGQISQYYAHQVGIHWFDRCYWFSSLGWAGHKERPPNVRAVYYATEGSAYDLLYAYVEATLVRGCSSTKISGDVFQSSKAVFKCDVRLVDGLVVSHHTDFYQTWGERDNIIVYDVVGRELRCQTIFLEPSLEQRAEAETLWNTAFVDVDVSDVDPTVYFSQLMGGPYRHVLFRNLKLPTQELLIRGANGHHRMDPRNVLFDRCLLHPNTLKSTPRDGIEFRDCYAP